MLRRASTLVAAEQTMPCTKRMASRIPKVGPFPRLIAPSDPTASAVVIICALRRDELRRESDAQAATYHVKSIEQTRVT